MKNKKFVTDEDFVNLGKLLRDDTDSVKLLKSLLDKESKYANYLGAIEFSIAEHFLENRKLKDEDVINMIKNIKENYLQNLDFFSKELEKNIMARLSFELQNKKITHHELKLAFNYVLWAIDNRSWMNENQAYVKWVAYSMGVFDSKETKEYEINFKKIAASVGIPKNKVDIMLLKDTENMELEKREKDDSMIESEFFALDDKEKFDFALNNLDQNPFLIEIYARELMDSEDYGAAEKFLKAALEKIPEYPPVEILLGLLYKEMSNNILAEHHLKNADRMIDMVPDEIFPLGIKKEMKNEIKRLLSDNVKSEDEEDFWEEGAFIETLGQEDIKEKMRTFHMKHDEEMNFNCKKCNKRISAHNKDWHDGMCDKCFDKEVYKK